MAIKIQNTTVINDDKSFVIKSGTASEKPASPEEGMVFYNTEINQYEIYSGSQWKNFIGSGLYLPSGTIQFSSTNLGTGWTALDGSVLLQSSYPTPYSAFGRALDTATSWVERSTSLNGFEEAFYGNGLYVVGSSVGTLRTSTNAINWSGDISSGAAKQIFAITYGNGLYLLSGKDAGIGTSTDAINWTYTADGIEPNAKNLTDVYGLAYGAGVYCAVGDNSCIFTSTDAITWTQRTSSLVGSQIINDVRFLEGRFVFVTDAGKIGNSTDGISWSINAVPGGSPPLSSVTYGKGLYVTPGAASIVYTSTNLINWTLRTRGPASSSSIVYIDNLFIIGNDTSALTDTINTSTDGINWTVGPASINGGIKALATNNGVVISASRTPNAITSWYPFSYDYATEFKIPNLYSTGTKYQTSFTIHQAYMKD